LRQYSPARTLPGDADKNELGDSMSMQFPWHDNDLASLAERHEQLLRTSQAMWHLLKSRLDLTDQDLHATLVQAEQESPVRLSNSPQILPSLLDCRVCRHPVKSTAKCCLYCGTAPQSIGDSATILRARHIQQ
jgi:hypothetical protein